MAKELCFQNAAQSVDIVGVLRDPSILLGDLNEELMNVEEDLLEAQELEEKAVSEFDGLQQQIEEQVENGELGAECIENNKDKISELVKQGGNSSVNITKIY